MSPPPQRATILPEPPVLPEADVSFDPKKAFNGLAVLPPSADLETPGVLRACLRAARSLAELKVLQERSLPRPVLLNTLPLVEACDSCGIESIHTTADTLFRYLGAESPPPESAARAALGSRAALERAWSLLDRRAITLAVAVEICRAIRGEPVKIRDASPARVCNATSGDVVYTPPAGRSRLLSLLMNWEKYLGESGPPDPLIRLAVAHYQFEAIHPFADGNGRTGRVLNILCLVRAGLLSLPVICLSRAMIRHQARYYTLLGKVTAEAAWEEWAIYVLESIEEGAKWTQAKILASERLLAATGSYVHRILPALYSPRLIELIFRYPGIRISHLVRAGVGARTKSAACLRALAGAGVLEELRLGREKIFLNTRFIALLSGDSHSWFPFPD